MSNSNTGKQETRGFFNFDTLVNDPVGFFNALYKTLSFITQGEKLDSLHSDLGKLSLSEKDPNDKEYEKDGWKGVEAVISNINEQLSLLAEIFPEKNPSLAIRRMIADNNAGRWTVINLQLNQMIKDTSSVLTSNLSASSTLEKLMDTKQKVIEARLDFAKKLEVDDNYENKSAEEVVLEELSSLEKLANIATFKTVCEASSNIKTIIANIQKIMSVAAPRFSHGESGIGQRLSNLTATFDVKVSEHASKIISQGLNMVTSIFRGNNVKEEGLSQNSRNKPNSHSF